MCLLCTYIYKHPAFLCNDNVFDCRSKFDSQVNNDVVAILLKEVQLANPQFQACQIRGELRNSLTVDRC